MKLRPALIELVVSDMAATLAFYRRLGLDLPGDADSQPHVDFDIGGGLRLAFACDSPAEVDAAWAELTTAGYDGHLAPWDAFWGMRYAVVNDPDGTPVDLLAPLPAG